MIKATKKALSRGMWMARGTATMVGLAVMLAGVLSLGTTALAAVPGDPFKLGQINTVDAVSELVGSVSGPMLSVKNDRSDRAAHALSLQMGNPNLTPMRTNATGHVNNLNVDLLDGRDSTSFADGVNGKAKNAAKADFATFAGEAQNAQVAAGADNLDGKDSAACFSGKTYTATREANGVGKGRVITVAASCDPGDNLLSGGGGSITDVQDDTAISSPLSSREWSVSFQDNDSPSKFFTRVLCADFPPLR